MSNQNDLVLMQRQTSNRDVRILLKTSSNLNKNKQAFQSSNFANKTKQNKHESTLYASSLQSSADTDYDFNYDCEEDNPDTTSINQENKNRYSNHSKKIDTENFEIFLYNFNRIALGCYLKVMRAQLSFWSLYSLDESMVKETNFDVLKHLNPAKIDEKKLIYCLKDENFIENYIELIVLIHNKIVSKLYQVLNNPLIHVHLNLKNTSKSSDDSRSHLFRSFRILGLRNLRTKSKNANSQHINQSDFQHNFNPSSVNCDLIKRNFTDLIDIRGSFDIRQFQNKTGYDCFVECEMNYFKIQKNKPVPQQQARADTCKSNLTGNKHVFKRNNIDYFDYSTNCWNEYLNKNLINQNNNAAFKFTDNDLSDLFLENLSKKSTYHSATISST